MSNNKQSSVRILSNKIQNLEWVFQFNDDDPIHFAEPSLFGYSNELSFTIGNTTDSIITFDDGKGNSFKLFAREKKSYNNEQQ
jgi:hypothetical protein